MRGSDFGGGSVSRPESDPFTGGNRSEPPHHPLTLPQAGGAGQEGAVSVPREGNLSRQSGMWGTAPGEEGARHLVSVHSRAGMAGTPPLQTEGEEVEGPHLAAKRRVRGEQHAGPPGRQGS